MLTHFRMAIQFLVGMARQIVQNIKVVDTLWQLHGESVEVTMYFPRGKPQGTILMVHGMNSLGAQDPRIIRLCQILTSVGFICVAPTIKSITHHLILPSQIQTVRRVIQYMLNDKTTCPSGELAIFTASFSGAISIIAASDPSVRDKITALLTIGIHYDGAVTITDIVSKSCEDYFAHLVGLKNLFHFAGQVDSVIDGALEAALKDDFTYIDDGHVAAYLQTLSAHEQQRVKTLLAQTSSRTYEVPVPVWEKFSPDKIREDFSFFNLLDDLPFRIYALQSREDKIMYAHRARELKQHMQRNKMHHRVLITPLLDHADTVTGVKYILDFVKIAFFMRAYFKDIDVR